MATQFNRNTWEVQGIGDMIRIQKEERGYKIIVFDFTGTYTFDLTEKEYKELKEVYFGDMKPDYAYLVRIGATENA